MSPPNKDGWINPDVAFAPSRPLKPARNDIPGDTAVCDKWVEKFSECERALQTFQFDGSEEKTETKEIVAAEQCLQEKNGATAYLQRFIHLLLEVSNLNNIEVQPENWAKLKFSISSDHLHTLRKFASEGDVKSIPLRKLDEILGSVLVKPYFSLPEFNIGEIVNKLPSFHIGSFFISILLPAVWFLLILLTTKNIKKSFIWLIPVLFVTSFITTATQMFEEAQIEQYMKIKKHTDAPQNCGGSFIEWAFGTSKCSKFFKAHHMDPNLGITPFKVLTKMCGETMADTMLYFGSGTFGFFQSFQELGFVTQIWALPLASVVLVAFGVLISLVITGGTGRLPFFMGSFSFHNQGQANSSCHADDQSPLVAPQKTEALPSTGNITVNINHVPPNMHQLLASLSSGVLPSIGQHLASPSTSALPDPLAGGDVHNLSHMSRPHFGFGIKKVNKQFSQLSSKYKSGGKSNKLVLKRARNASL